jgi:hypothetical protein
MFASQPNKLRATAQFGRGRPLRGYRGGSTPAEGRTKSKKVRAAMQSRETINQSVKVEDGL